MAYRAACTVSIASQYLTNANGIAGWTQADTLKAAYFLDRYCCESKPATSQSQPLFVCASSFQYGVE
jgi:hypothetical protein